MRIFASPLHLSSWNYTGAFPMSQGWALLTSGSKGPKSRSQFIDFGKWLMSHNSFPFTPIIMKLHTKTPLEWRVCPMGFGVQRSKVKVTMQWLLFLWRITAFPLHLQSANFTHRFPVSQEYALLILGLQMWRVWIGCRGGYLSLSDSPILVDSPFVSTGFQSHYMSVLGLFVQISGLNQATSLLGHVS